MHDLERKEPTDRAVGTAAAQPDLAAPGREPGNPSVLTARTLALPEGAGGRSGLLALQRSAGNRAVSTMFPPPGRRPVVQRALTEEQKKSWEELKGPEQIQLLKDKAAEWKTFRGKPAAYASLPKAGPAFGKLADLLATGEPAYKQHAATELGSDAIKYLSEMTGFVHGARLLVNVVPGLMYVDPGHTYKLKMDEGAVTGVLNKIPMVPVAGYVVEYSNAYGWNWSKHLTGGQLGWSVGVGVEKGKGVSGGGVADTGGKGAGKTGRGMIPMPGTISVNSNAQATSVGYWGYEDLPGPALIVNGPSAKLTVRGAGYKKVSGGLISLTGTGGGPPGSLDFMNLESDLKIDPLAPSGPERPSEVRGGDKKSLDLSLSLVEGAIGALVGGAQEVSIPELVPTPVPEEKIWRYHYFGFETGSAEVKIPPGEVRSILDMIKFDIEDKQRSHDSIKPMLAEAGIDEEFKLDFFCEGYASRMWKGATSDADRQAKNKQLSTERAQNVAAMLYEQFGPSHTYAGEGRGAAVWIPGAGNMVGEVVPEGNTAEIEAKMRAYEDRLRARNKGSVGALTEEQIEEMLAEHRKGLERQNAKDSDIQYARRVNIMVTFRGHTITFAAGFQPAPTPV